MNLFWKKRFGGMLSTSKFEKMEEAAVSDMKRYDEIAKSLELEEYRKLFHVVKSSEFKEKKKTLQNRKYQDTEEYRISRKYQKLHTNSSIRQYYETLHSERLNTFLDFKSTPEYEELGDKKKVKASEKLQKLKDFENSKEYKNYIRYHDSFIIRDYEELKKKIANPEFVKSNQFWADQHRWKTVPEHAVEQRYYELAKNPDIIFYENEKPARFEKYRKLSPAFIEDFDWYTLDKSRWAYGFHASNEQLIGNYSFDNEHQANSGGKNVSVVHGTFTLETKHEKSISRAWNPTKGFYEKEFDYTSDVVQTADEFRQTYGIFKAKIRCTGRAHHAFWLSNNSKLPHINIFHYDGKAITMGNAHQNVMDEVRITGLKHSSFYIYTLEWTPKELIWYINDLEVHRTTSNVPKENLYLGFNSFLPNKEKPSTGKLEVDWVKVLTFK